MDKNRNRIIGWIRVCVLALFCSGFLWRCANIMKLEGGPIDTIPPVVVGMLPEDYTTGYPILNGPKIYISFDEFVQIKDQQKEFFTSPRMKKTPQVSVRGRGIMIQIKDTLLENTTYALNFGSSIRDNNEGNPLYSLRYVFSTGPEVDSMVCSGYTEDSYKADSVPQSFIYFFPADSVEYVEAYDSTLFKYTPAVIARAETNGIFIAQNLKPIPYRVYAFQDKNSNMIYEPSVDQVGFLEGTYNPAELPDFAIWYDSIRRYVVAEPQLYFRMFTDVAFARQYLRESERPAQHKALLYFNAKHPRIEQIVFDSIPAEKVVVDPQSQGADTIALWFNLPSEQLPDTIRGEITYERHDSVDQLVTVTEKLKLAWRYIESKEEAKERERLEKEREKALAAGEEWIEPEKPSTFAYKFSTSGSVTPETHLSVLFDYPLVRMDSASIVMKRIENKDTILTPIRWVQDTANMRNWFIEAPWQLKTDYMLTIPKGALADMAQQQNDSISLTYKGIDPEKYATFIVNVVGKSEDASYIVQMLNDKGALLQEKTEVKTGPVRFNYVPAGNVKFRVIEDANGNGRWDTGNVVERRQPERAEYYVNENGEDIFVSKENWEVEVTMDMNKVFAPVTMQTLVETLEKREMQRLQKLYEQRTGKNGQTTNNTSLQR
ncbi:Ig-like domain-containing protein [uncultured Alistipes sp.]|uniref:Ig-like domain-containing protein n=1 Tax=uncultured Alistipes sp. TaxID=538949 RepID=UPI00260EA2A0|nr:Ig-like domain-containing protein [uncultured Alistipes sp.]